VFGAPGPRRLAWLGITGLAVIAVIGIVVARSTTVNVMARAAWRQLSTQRQAATWLDSPAPRAVQITVDPKKVLRPINPLIYGLAHASSDELDQTGATLNRWGGNPNSRYNWEVGNAWNAARDWEFRNYGQDGDAIAAPSAMADQFVSNNVSHDVASVITVPALGWVARSGNRDRSSTGVPGHGGPPLGGGASGATVDYDPTSNRSATSIASFARKNGPFADPPDTLDSAVFQDEWIAHLVSHFRPADAGGIRYYAIDNEPDLWSFTHTDVHPVDPDYDEELSTFLDYAAAIKDVDPGAQILGPTLSGWTGLFYSARDRGTDRYRTHADRRAHGDMPFLPWWLDQVRRHDQQVGRRTLDVLDVHWYPQNDGVFAGNTDEATNRLRLRSTRSLWDSSYVDESWIGDTVQLIPRLRRWIDQYYPDTRLAIGEWNWGADKTMNGALTIANVLGIFGREGVDLAAYWTSPSPDSLGAQAFAMYTNYDGQQSVFGDVAVASASSAPDDVQIFASRDSSTGDILLMLLNQRPDTDLPTTVQITESATTVASMYRLDATTTHIREEGAAEIDAGKLQLDLPAESITLLRVGPS
jgi:hypothetical protein